MRGGRGSGAQRRAPVTASLAPSAARRPTQHHADHVQRHEGQPPPVKHAGSAGRARPQARRRRRLLPARRGDSLGRRSGSGAEAAGRGSAAVRRRAPSQWRPTDQPPTRPPRSRHRRNGRPHCATATVAAPAGALRRAGGKGGLTAAPPPAPTRRRDAPAGGRAPTAGRGRPMARRPACRPAPAARAPPCQGRLPTFSPPLPSGAPPRPSAARLRRWRPRRHRSAAEGLPQGSEIARGLPSPACPAPS